MGWRVSMGKPRIEPRFLDGLDLDEPETLELQRISRFHGLQVDLALAREELAIRHHDLHADIVFHVAIDPVDDRRLFSPRDVEILGVIGYLGQVFGRDGDIE